MCNLRGGDNWRICRYPSTAVTVRIHCCVTITVRKRCSNKKHNAATHSCIHSLSGPHNYYRNFIATQLTFSFAHWRRQEGRQTFAYLMRKNNDVCNVLHMHVRTCKCARAEHAARPARAFFILTSPTKPRRKMTKFEVLLTMSAVSTQRLKVTFFSNLLLNCSFRLCV